MTSTESSTPTGLRARIEAAAMIEAERALAPTLQALAELTDSLTTTANDTTKAAARIERAAERQATTSALRALGMLALVLIVTTSGAAIGATAVLAKGWKIPFWGALAALFH